MRLTGLLLLLLVLFGSCRKEKLKASDAFFIRPTNVSVTTTVVTQGSASEKITDLWLYVNGFFKGVYPSGSTLPVPSTGPTEVIIYPGIKNNGISTTRQPYEFYAPIEIDTAVNPNVVVNRNLAFKYKTNTVFHYIETFNGGTSGVGMKTSPGSDIITYKVLNNPNDSFDGKYMYFTLNSDSTHGFFESTAQYPLPVNGAPVYMELNYKCNQPFTVGVCNGSDYRELVVVNRSDNWNKIYVQLSTGVSISPTYSKYGICIRAAKDADVPQPEFFIDNIKLISY